MRIVVIDSVGCNAGDAGTPAQFSAATIAWLEARGHDVHIFDSFDRDACAAADAVWSEWANNDAFIAAASGVCKRLVIRVRGYELWAFPLERVPWNNVHALVHESQYLHEVASRRKLPVRQVVIPGGIDLGRFPFKPRGPGNVVGMLGRAEAVKGYDLALEWAHRNADLQLHIVLTGGDPRIAENLQLTAPANVHVQLGRVDTAAWLDGIGANYLLSASSWESLGYTIVEALALGVQPLVRRRPETDLLWPFPCWRTLDELDALARQPWDAAAGRVVAEKFDADRVAPLFASLLQAA